MTNPHTFMQKPATWYDFGLTPDEEERASQLHDELIVFDSLMECSWYDGMITHMKKGGPATGSLSIGHIDFSKLRGEKKPEIPPEEWWTAETLTKNIRYVKDRVTEHEADVMLCYTAHDLREAKRQGKVGLMLDNQNTEYVGKDVDVLDAFHALGIRRTQLTYNFTVAAGAGCMETRNSGLSRFGADIIERMEEIGMLVDTGHSHSSTLLDALDVAKKPLTCSHAGMASRCVNPRTQTDEALIKLADKGGVFGVISTPGALNGTDRCTVAEYVDTIDAAVKLMGIDHVGFGTDLILAASLEEILAAPEWNDKLRESVGVSIDVWPWSDGHLGMENNSGYVNLTRGLVAKGYQDDAIKKVMGGNFLRLIEDTIG